MAQVKNLPASARDTKHKHLITVGKIPQSRKWQLTPLFLPGKSHGQRSLLAYNPRDYKEWDTTEQLRTHTHTDIYIYIIQCKETDSTETREKNFLNGIYYSPVLLPGKSHGRREEPGRLQSMGSLRVGYD